MTATGKSTVDEIRARFDQDVERFANLETGQSATLDAPLVLDLVTKVAAQHNANAQTVLDVGCGAGNYTLKLLERLPGLHCTLMDLSLPMLERAQERLHASPAAEVQTIQADVRETSLPENHFDIILAAAVLHHLRSDAQWEATFAKLFASLRPGGILLVSDLVMQDIAAVKSVQWQRYGEYLTRLRDEAYCQSVLAYIDKEDTPRSVLYQIDMCRHVGFRQVDLLHLNACFGAYCAVK